MCNFSFSMARGPCDIVLPFPAGGLIKMQFHIWGEKQLKGETEGESEWESHSAAGLFSVLSQWLALPWDLFHGPPCCVSVKGNLGLPNVHSHTSNWQRTSLAKSPRNKGDGSVTDSKSRTVRPLSGGWWCECQMILWSSGWGRTGWHDNWSERNLEDDQTENDSI